MGTQALLLAEVCRVIRPGGRSSAPDSPDCILDLPDYYGFFTYSLLQGQVPAATPPA